MNVVSKIFHCSACGARTTRSFSQCEACKAWNVCKAGAPNEIGTGGVIRMSDIRTSQSAKTPTGISELDLVLGGGTETSQVILLAGPPGAGKSTLLLEVADGMKRRGQIVDGRERRKKNEVVYISSEEDVGQIKVRSDRLKRAKNILMANENDLASIEAIFAEQQAQYGIIDSIQGLQGGHGPAAIVENVKRMYGMAKALQMTLFIIGHFTKDDDIAGPRALEHYVDTTLEFMVEREGSQIRVLRARKNRSASTHYVGLFEMTNEGIYPLTDTSESVASLEPAVGRALGIVQAGQRTMLVEVQALSRDVGEDKTGRLSVIGYDRARVQQILAVLDKHLGESFMNDEVYVALPGGLEHKDAELDAAVAAALLSTKRQKPWRQEAVVGEIDLLGNVNRRDSSKNELAARYKLPMRMFRDLEGMVAK